MSWAQVGGAIAYAATLYITENPYYAAAAYTVVAGIGTLLLSPTNRTNGPRLSDLTNQISSYGATIPYLEGSFRIPGNVIWATDKIPIDTTTHTGGKGGGGTVSTTTRYVVNFAIAYDDVPLGEPECFGFARVWIDKKLAITLGPDADASSVIASAGIASAVRFYGGSQTQPPDPLIESYEGVGNTSAFRGTCYLVFENFEITPYGNRIPQVEVEIIRSGAGVVAHHNICSLTASDAGVSGMRGRSWITDNLIYLWRQVASSVDYTHITLFVSHDGQEKTPLGLFTIPAATIQEAFPVNTRDRFLIETVEYGTDPLTGFNTQRIVILDPLFTVVLLESTLFDTGRWNIDLREWGSTSDTFGDNSRMVAFDQDSHVAAFAIRTTNPRYFAERISVSSEGQATPYEYPLTGVGVCCALACAAGKVFAMVYETDGHMHLVVLAQADGSLISDFDGPTEAPNLSATDVVDSIRTDGASVWAWSSGTGLVWRWNSDGTLVILATGIEGVNDAGSSTGMLGGQQCFIGDTHLIMQGQAGFQASGSDIYRHQLVHWNATSSTAVPLSDIVDRVAARAPALTVDTTELEDIMVTGSLVTKQMARSDYLTYLAAIYHFDGQPDGATLAFKIRGGDPVLTIDIDDMAAHDFGAESPEPLPIDRQKELDVPQFVSVNFTDINNDDLPGNIPAQRLNTQSEQQLTLDATAVTMDATAAAKLADIAKMTSLLERTTFTFATSYKYKGLQPGDVVLLDSHDFVSRARLTQVTDQAGLLQMEAVADEAFVYDSAAVGTGRQSSVLLALKAASELQLLDIPILRNEDDNEAVYGRATPANAGSWPGANIVRTDGDTLDVLGAVSQVNPVGVALNALPDWHGIGSFDESSYLDVQLRLSTETLSSFTRAAALGGAGAIALGSGANVEILFYRTATMLSAGVYRLTGLLRYQRGTNGATHAIGDRFVMLGVAGTLRVPADVGVPHEYKAVTLGRLVDSAPTVRFTSSGRAQLPFTPVQLGYGEDGSGGLEFNWRRRTRLITPFGQQAPLGEDFESYRVDFSATPDFADAVSFSTATPSLALNAAQRATLPGLYWRPVQLQS